MSDKLIKHNKRLAKLLLLGAPKYLIIIERATIFEIEWLSTQKSRKK